MQNNFIDSPSGARLHTYQVKTKKPAKAVIQINHGMAEHGARYERFASQLADAGYHVFIHDHRGHGKTQADDAPLGQFSNENGWEKVIEDTLAVNQHIKTRHPQTPVIMFGHSMGSIITLNYCIQHGSTISAAACWNSGADGGALLFLFSTLLKIERFFKGSDAASSIAYKLTFEDWNKKFAPNRTQFDWLTRDEKEVDKYVADPLCGFPVSNGLYQDVLSGIKIGASNTQLAKINQNLPIYLLGGADDPCTRNGAAMSLLASRLKKLGMNNIRCDILQNTRHESLNEINRDETISAFINWLEER